jgi:2-keto-4-pentenoate hydratase/2-oxohepta-3-ene-1,7-dioic acid hydratase in catechol pathway
LQRVKQKIKIKDVALQRLSKTKKMKLLTYKTSDTEPRLGFIHNNQIIDMEDFGEISNFPLPSTMLELIDLGYELVKELNDMITETDQELFAEIAYEMDEVTFLAPIPKPRKNIIGIGLNYTEHVAESARTLDTTGKLPQKPIIFSKPPTTVTATNTEIIKNTKLTEQLDWEVELAVVIGKKGKYVSKADAMDYVFGYTVINDISARDCRREGQWIVSKGQDTFAPMGPILVTKDEIENPHNLNLSLKVNGIEKQNSNTKFLLFNINDLIEDLSTVFTLEPGDIIATGTPSGVGAGRNPQEWLYDGDVIEASVEGIGTIMNTVKEISR